MPLPNATLAPSGTLAPSNVIDDIAAWYLIHKNIAGVELGEVQPDDLEFAMYLDKPGYANYNLNRNHHMATPAYTQAYTTDWELWRGDIRLEAGMHTNIGVPDFTGSQVQVSGQSWLHYLERRIYPFDPQDLAIYPQFTKVTTDSFTVVQDLLTSILALTSSLVLTYNNGTSGNVINYKIELGDAEDIYSKIKAISEMDPGFNFEITPAREFKMYAPRKTRTITNYQIAQQRNISELSNYENTGIEATHILAVGQGPQSKLGRLIGDAPAAVVHRRHDKHIDFGNITDSTTLLNLGNAELTKSLIPNVAFSLKIRPEVNVWELIRTGDKIWVDADTDYERIFGYYRIIGIQLNLVDRKEEITIHFDDENI